MEFLQTFIDLLRGKPASVQIGGRQEYWKSVGVCRHCGDIETLILGSSHAQCGYSPGENEFNLGLPSQDLYYSAALYGKLSPSLSRLKRIVLFYSVFSPGFELERTENRCRCFHYEVYFGIPWKSGDCRAKAASGLKWIERRYRKFCSREQVPDSYRGEDMLEYVEFIGQSPEEVAATAAGHLKNNRRGNGQTGFVSGMADAAAASGVKLIVVIPPVRADYRAGLPESAELFGELFALGMEKGFTVCDMMAFAGIPEAGFRDSDHLNACGARALTAAVKAFF